jgi:hypothetical protein
VAVVAVVAVVAEAAALGDRLVPGALAVAALPVPPAGLAAGAAEVAADPALAWPLPGLAQPAVTMTAASPATAASRYRRLAMPCLPPSK